MPFRKSRGAHRQPDPGRPVFVDATGRRLRRARTAAMVVLAGIVTYVALVASAFVGGPNIVGPLLPGALAPQKPAPTHSTEESSPPPVHTPLPAEPVAGTPDRPSRIAPAIIVSPPSTPGVPSGTASHATAPGSNATSTPGRSGAAPGQANRPVSPGRAVEHSAPPKP